MDDKIEVFDGVNQVLVDRCCEGKVIQREVHEGQAFRNMVEGMQRKSSSLHCMKCGRELPPTPKPPREPRSFRR